LHLPAPGLVAADALRCEHRLAQRVVDRHVGKLRLRQVDERHAEPLQLGHFLLAFRLADGFVLHRHL
jgi:hypothetical protein